MTNNKPNDVRVVPVELLDRIVNLNNSFADHRQAQHDLVKFLAQPADQQGEPEPFIVGNHYRTQSGRLVRFVTVKQEGTPYETMMDETGCHRYTSRDHGRVTGSAHDFSHPENVAPLYRHAQPATAKVDERAEFARWTVSEGRVLGYTGWNRDFAVWLARAKLNGGAQ